MVLLKNTTTSWFTLPMTYLPKLSYIHDSISSCILLFPCQLSCTICSGNWQMFDMRSWKKWNDCLLHSSSCQLYNITKVSELRCQSAFRVRAWIIIQEFEIWYLFTEKMLKTESHLSQLLLLYSKIMTKYIISPKI